MFQEYTSGVYQPGTPYPDPKIRLIQPYLGISDSPFSSAELLTLELLLPPRGNPMNITILDDPISSITYISQVPSTSPTTGHSPMDTHQNI